MVALNRYSSTWNIEKEESLRRLTAQKLPLAVIAETLGATSVSAVGSKMLRMGISRGLIQEWGTDREDALRTLIADPRGLSAREIAKELGGGASRNGIIGKIRRLGLKLPGARGSEISNEAKQKRSERLKVEYRTREHKPRVVRRSTPDEIARRREAAIEHRLRLMAVEIVDLTPEQSSSAVNFFDLTKKSCRWPISGDARELSDMKFCGVTAAEGCSYCGSHKRMAYRQPRL